MALLKRDHMDLLLGIGVLALGLGLLVFTFSHALALAGSPGDFLRTQMPQNQTPKGPSASFRWDSNGFNVTVADTSRQGDAAITSWDWDFGDGSRQSGQNPGMHTYASPGPYQTSLIVRDGRRVSVFAMPGGPPSDTTSRRETDSATPSRIGERTPVMIARTRRIPSNFRSTRTPKITFASGRIPGVSPSTTAFAVRRRRPGRALM